MEYQLSDNFGFSIDALYVQEGTMRMDPRYVYFQTQLSWDNSSLLNTDPHTYDTYYLSKINTNVVMHNIEIPVMLNYYLPEMNGLQPKIQLGGSFDYIYKVYARNLLAISHYDYWGNLDIYGDDMSSYEAFVLPERETDDITESFEYYNAGIVGGIGFSFNAFTFDVRYKAGLMPISNLATFKYQNTSREDFSTNTLFVSLGIKLNKL
jgi:hypothetical protein